MVFHCEVYFIYFWYILEFRKLSFHVSQQTHLRVVQENVSKSRFGVERKQAMFGLRFQLRFPTQFIRNTAYCE